MGRGNAEVIGAVLLVERRLNCSWLPLLRLAWRLFRFFYSLLGATPTFPFW